MKTNTFSQKNLPADKTIFKHDSKNNKDFPHYYRIIAARLWRLFSFSVILTFIVAFLFSTYSSSPAFEQLKQSALENYQDPQIHLALAKKYRKANDLDDVKRELLIALNYAPEDDELIKEFKTVENIQKEPIMISGEIKNWEKIVKDYPNYRDAYLYLARLNLIIYEKDKAQAYLDQALKLDPNFEPTKKLQMLIYSQGERP